MNRESQANPFILQSLVKSLGVLSSLKQLMHKHIQLRLTSDGSFFYQKDSKVCMEIEIDGQTYKLGFGSSATTVVSIVCVLLIEGGEFDLKTCLTRSLVDEERELIARIACDAHNAAQGRIGSGFDVVTAVFGSCSFEKTDSFCIHSPFSLPPHIGIAVSCGGKGSSRTPVLVRQIKSWREKEESKELWREYSENNESLVQGLSEGRVDELKDLFEAKLEIMHKISECSGSQIVPDELYEVMKATNRLEGVVGCIVAGAGGFDSFYCLYDDRKTQRKAFEVLWNQCDCSVSSIRDSQSGLQITPCEIDYV